MKPARPFARALLTLALLAVGGAALRGEEAPAPPPADETEIRIAGQAADGSVWAIGAREGPAVFRWTGDRWEQGRGWTEWPGNVVDIAADPSRPDSVLTAWFGVAGDGGLNRTVQLWRHTPEAPARRVTAFPNPTVQNTEWGRSWPRLSVDPAGGAWFTFAAPVVLQVPKEGGAPRRIELPREAFAPVAGKEITEILPLMFFPDGPGSGWVWSADDASFPNGRGALFRPRRIEAGRLSAAAAPPGLPDDGRVVMVRADHAGRMVWALEKKGLWRVDVDGRRAEPIDSPPGAWRILDWRDWPDGRAVALVFAERGRSDRQQGELWTRSASGWTNHGHTGDTTSRVLRVNDWVSAPRDWWWRDGRLLGAGFHVGVVAAETDGGAAKLRVLDWQDAQYVAQPRRMFPLTDGRILLQGATSEVRAVDDWWAGKTRAEAAEAGGAAPVARTFSESPVLAPDGRLWILRTRGAGAPAIGHWDGAHWLEWPLPRERSWWPDDALWVDARGRVAVFSEDLERPAWELGARGAGWRAWPSGKALIESRAAERPCAATLPVVEDRFALTPMLSHRRVRSRGDARRGSLVFRRRCLETFRARRAGHARLALWVFRRRRSAVVLHQRHAAAARGRRAMGGRSRQVRGEDDARGAGAAPDQPPPRMGVGDRRGAGRSRAGEHRASRRDRRVVGGRGRDSLASERGETGAGFRCGRADALPVGQGLAVSRGARGRARRPPLRGGAACAVARLAGARTGADLATGRGRVGCRRRGGRRESPLARMAAERGRMAAGARSRADLAGTSGRLASDRGARAESATRRGAGPAARAARGL